MMYRTAETLFWIGRYIERAENNARRIDINFHMRHVLADNEGECRWEKLIASLGDISLFKKHFNYADETSSLQFLTFDEQNHNSLFSTIRHTRNNIRSLRQLLPSEIWDSINGFYLWLSRQNVRTLMAPSPYTFYQHFQEWLSRFNGTADSTMLRDNEWNFIQAGKFFERTENAIRTLHSFYLNSPKGCFGMNNPQHYNYYMLLLKSTGSYEAFRRSHADDVSFEKIVEFLLLHPTFPRSVQYSLTALENYLLEIKQQDYQFSILADTVENFVGKMKNNLTNLQTENDQFLGLSFIQTMFDGVNMLGLDISNTFFQEDILNYAIENITYNPLYVQESGNRQCQ